MTVLVLTGSCLIRYIHQRYFVDKQINIQKVSVLKLKDKINPNTASWASLARLPGIGETRARYIISYRKIFKQTYGSNAVAFTSSNDMIKVKNVGPVIVDQIEEYLIFDLH